MSKILLAILVFATSALAADFTGNWTGEGTVNGESHSLYFIFKLDGNTVTGSGGPNATEQHPFEGGKVEGDKITFDVHPSEKGSFHFELKADGEGLKGTVELRREEGKESGTVTLKKAT